MSSISAPCWTANENAIATSRALVSGAVGSVVIQEQFADVTIRVIADRCRVFQSLYLEIKGCIRSAVIKKLAIPHIFNEPPHFFFYEVFTTKFAHRAHKDCHSNNENEGRHLT